MTIREYILKETKCKDFTDLKKKLFRSRKYNYGCYFSEIKCKGFDAFYTSNDNHFCEYGFRFQGIGMSSTYGIDESSITKAGHSRSCSSHYINETFLNKQYNTK